MGKHAEKIRQGFAALARKAVGQNSILAQVKSVDEDEFTCVLFDEETGVDYEDVRLRPVIDGNESLTLFPKIDSWVVAIQIEDSEDWQIVSVSEIDKYRVVTGNRTIEQDADGLLIKNGNDTLKDCLKLIIEGVQGIVVIQGTNPDYAKLAQAMIKLNNLLK